LKLKITALIVIFTFMISLPVVQAFDWSGSSINSGYAVRTDWHGLDVPSGTPVRAWAGTTDQTIERVWFRWIKPDKTENITVQGTYSGETVYGGETVYEWSNTQTPDDLGDWGVQVEFHDGEGQGVGPIPELPEPIAVRAISFNHVPEVPIGTIAILLGMFGALSIFVLKKKYLP